MAISGHKPDSRAAADSRRGLGNFIKALTQSNKSAIFYFMDINEFEDLVDKGIAEIPQKFLIKLKNVAIVVEEEPSAEQTKKMKLRKDYTLFGLYEGVPQIKRSAYYSALPDKITIFKKPIEQFAQSPDEIKKIVKNTVWHEIAHHFGMSEEEIRKIEKKRFG